MSDSVMERIPKSVRPAEDSWLRRTGEVLVQSGKDLFTDGGPQWAAAIAYYSLLSLFPLLLALTAIAAYFIDPDRAVQEATLLLGDFVPEGEDEIRAIVQDAIEARGTVGLLSLITLLWTGSRVFGAMTRALNIAYDVDEVYSFWKRTLIEFAMVLTVGLFFLLAISSRALINLGQEVLHLLPTGQGIIARITESVVPVILLLVSFFLIYRFVPRRAQSWRSALAGAVVATLLFVIARPLFLAYLRRFGDYNVVYGSIAMVIILVLWAWIVALILLYGGEVASHTQAMIFEGQSPEAVRRRHEERSPTRTDLIHRRTVAGTSGESRPGPSSGASRPKQTTLGTVGIAAMLAGVSLLRWWARR